ncbi:unnamed protein product [Enterobius vermicularis]|uniref:Uncharacterized protein n=1 Tax=Enterobius vermicularis TaxID=51028 RepID=A0A0N4UTE0_ENTVE|nr:unnamed protein product [Enterobius vermicularis]
MSVFYPAESKFYFWIEGSIYCSWKSGSCEFSAEA